MPGIIWIGAKDQHTAGQKIISKCYEFSDLLSANHRLCSAGQAGQRASDIVIDYVEGSGALSRATAFGQPDTTVSPLRLSE
jgi:hypothetical protein